MEREKIERETAVYMQGVHHLRGAVDTVRPRYVYTRQIYIGDTQRGRVMNCVTVIRRATGMCTCVTTRLSYTATALRNNLRDESAREKKKS